MKSVRRGRRRLLARALLTLLLCALGAAPAVGQTTYWVGGYEVEISLTPKDVTVIVGEPIQLSFNIHNRSDTDLEVMLGGDARADRGEGGGFKVTVVGEDGRAAPRPDERPGYAGSATVTFVGAGQSKGLLLSLTDWAKFDKPGLYTVTCGRAVSVAPHAGGDAVLLDERRPPVEVQAQARVRVVTAEEGRLARLIEELGAQVLGNHQPSAVEAAQKLALLDDERILKYFVEAFRKSKDPSLRYTVLASFSKFRADLALEGLRLGATDASDDVRTAAASALAASPHPKARELLLTMRRDPYYGVRLVVLHALVKGDDDESLTMIREMVNDEHEMVSGEALRYLNERAARRRP